jgi:hypothetical protein
MKPTHLRKPSLSFSSINTLIHGVCRTQQPLFSQIQLINPSKLQTLVRHSIQKERDHVSNRRIKNKEKKSTPGVNPRSVSEHDAVTYHFNISIGISAVPAHALLITSYP